MSLNLWLEQMTLGMGRVWGEGNPKNRKHLALYPGVCSVSTCHAALEYGHCMSNSCDISGVRWPDKRQVAHTYMYADMQQVGYLTFGVAQPI